jgi:hypothetical protein
MKRFLILLFLFVPLAAHATCSHEDAPYELKRTDPAFEEAMKLKENLSRQGIEVTCVLPSKVVGMFEGQLGAASYRTTVGNIEVMFLRPSTEFEIHVVERKQDGRYLYSFEGKRPSNVPVWDASHPCFFVQFHNAMFTANDERMAQRLKALVRPD